jgi:hypothetical protein
MRCRSSKKILAGLFGSGSSIEMTGVHEVAGGDGVGGLLGDTGGSAGHCASSRLLKKGCQLCAS